MSFKEIPLMKTSEGTVLFHPYISKNSLKKVKQVLESGRVNYWTGNECKNFEKAFSNYHNVKYSLCV